MPPQKLTPSLVRTLGAPGVRSEHRDLVVPGLVLRVTAKGARSWCYYYTMRGRNYRVTLGKLEKLDLPGARKLAKAESLKVLGGRNPAQEKRQARTHAGESVGSLVDGMLDRVKLRPSTLREWRRLARVELEPVRHRPAPDLARSEVRLWLHRIADRSGWTANHALDVLRRAYSWGLEMELVPHSPCVGIRKPYRGEASERVLSLPEVRALWRALDVLGEGQYADAVRLLLLTGVRRGAVLGAQRREFADVENRVGSGGEVRGAMVRLPGDHDEGGGAVRVGAGATRGARTGDARQALQPESAVAWTVPPSRSKSGRAHVVPLSPQAAAVVRRRMDAWSGAYLFPTHYLRRDGQQPAPYMTITSAWIRRLKAATIWQLRREVGHGLRAKMAPWHLHNLRHTLATHMAQELGVAEPVIALILGHTPPGRSGATKVYQRADYLPERRAALALWGDFVEALAKGGKSNVLPMKAR